MFGVEMVKEECNEVLNYLLHSRAFIKENFEFLTLVHSQ
uniref:Uncharacterized protein n=1 Tax=Rhizophora mucronata TaxID=61149 RepID=A0A2P2LVG3_RHIMU